MKYDLAEKLKSVDEEDSNMLTKLWWFRLLLKSPKHQFQADVCIFQQELQALETPEHTPLLETLLNPVLYWQVLALPELAAWK